MSDHNCTQEVFIAKIDERLDRIQTDLGKTVSWRVFVFLFSVLGGLGFYGNVMTNSTNTAISKLNEKLAVIEYKIESHFKTQKADCIEDCPLTSPVVKEDKLKITSNKTNKDLIFTNN